MTDKKILKKYAGIKWAVILLVCTLIVFMIDGNLLMLMVNGAVLIYFLKLKKKYGEALKEDVQDQS